MYQWTTPYCGLSYLGTLKDIRRASIDDRGEVVFLKKWWKGCGFSPHEVRFQDIESAKIAGKSWVCHGA